RPWRPAATRTGTSAKSWVRTSCGCLLPVRDPLLGTTQRVAAPAVEGVRGARDKEVGRRRCQDVVTVQRQPSLLDVDPAHPKKERLGCRPVGLVLERT